jgi:hypothetical protein
MPERGKLTIANREVYFYSLNFAFFISDIRPIIIVSICCGTEFTYVQILYALIMSVIISKVYTVAIFINVDYEQCCICVGTFMVCLHTRLHCSCDGVLVVIDINRKISERPPSY